MDSTNLRSFQELASVNNSLFHCYFSDVLAKFCFYNRRVNLLQICSYICAVVQFYPWFKFYFLLFQNHYHTIAHPKTKENQI